MTQQRQQQLAGILTEAETEIDPKWLKEYGRKIIARVNTEFKKEFKKDPLGPTYSGGGPGENEYMNDWEGGLVFYFEKSKTQRETKENGKIHLTIGNDGAGSEVYLKGDFNTDIVRVIKATKEAMEDIKDWLVRDKL